jgi:hypothetical protein
VSRRALAALLALACAGASPAARPPTALRLADGATGAPLLSCVLRDGERAVLTWRNSLFGLDVTEVFVARGGGLELSSVSFAQPGGGPPPAARAEDLDDLYHTGGPFAVEGIARPVRHVVFRVGAIGDPTFTVAGSCVAGPREDGSGSRRLRFLDEVGFGGTVVLDASSGALAGPPPAEAKPRS